MRNYKFLEKIAEVGFRIFVCCAFYLLIYSIAVVMGHKGFDVLFFIMLFCCAYMLMYSGWITNEYIKK